MSFSLDLGFRKAAAEPTVQSSEAVQVTGGVYGNVIFGGNERKSIPEANVEIPDALRPSPCIVLDRQEANEDQLKAEPIWGCLLWPAALFAGILLAKSTSFFVEPPGGAVLSALLVLFGIGAVLGILATLSLALRKLENPLYWQLLAWFLVAIGIILRPVVLDRKDLDIRLSAVAVAGVLAVIVLPFLMRWLNRVKPEPGLIHAALPLALGVFLDVTQLAAQSYVVPKLAKYLGP